MPRPRARALFELAGQWIAEEPGRVGFYRFWNDPSTGRTRRASLGTSDLSLAKIALAEIVVQGAPKTTDSYLSIVLEKYFVEHADHLRTKGQARRAGKLFLLQWGTKLRVSDVTEAKQKAFVTWALNEQNYAVSYVERLFGVLAAAIAHSKITIDLVITEADILAKWPEFKPKPERDIYEPTDEELARLLSANIPNDFRRWVLNSMATAGRPEAVLELAPAHRQREQGLIDLNVPGRRQNKKFRATVRVLPSQRKWLDKWEKEGLALHAGRYCGYYCVDSVDTAIRRARIKDDINIPGLTALSFRNRATTVLRNSKKPRVPGEQISYQLGHKRAPGGEARTTRRYGQFEPDYLAEAAQVLEAWVSRVLKLAAQPAAAARPTAKTRKAA